jgi:hypothetical protein
MLHTSAGKSFKKFVFLVIRKPGMLQGVYQLVEFGVEHCNILFQPFLFVIERSEEVHKPNMYHVCVLCTL